MQNCLFDNISTKQTFHKQSKYHKPDKIWQNIKEWNTIEGIELYKPLYDLCSQLFLLTCNNKLECLNYYIDEEIDESKSYTVMLAEIDNTWHLPLKERYEQHLKLLDRIMNNDTTLVHDEKIIDSDKLTLFNYVYN